LDSPALGLYVAGLPSAAGVCLGTLVHTARAALGVGELLRAFPDLFLALPVKSAVGLAAGRP
jgi:threonine/homoserine/homoserine lactone efflux protein